MLGAGFPALDLSGFLQLACACLFFFAGWFYLTRKPALFSFLLNTVFEGKEEFQDRNHMPNGSRGSDAAGVGVSECPVCLRSASKKCSRCKSVWYCSQACQSKHWKAEHKSKCREVGSADKFDALGTCSRKKSSAISLVPGHGTRKILKEPKKILFPYDDFVKLFDWEKPGFPPCGLLNCGNSCFANVVLQCLAFTRPLVAYLLEKDHTRGCLRRRDDWCFLCELQIHIKRATESSQSFSPINILSRLPNIGGNLGYGRQEDAHEFMRFAIDTMQSICLDEFGGEKAVDPSTQETTIVQYIFGGHLRSQVICTKCDVVSNRYENMMDLTVEIHGDSESLEECLDQFTIKEWLDGENMYKCDGCNDYVKAWKRLTVHQAPNILTIALKRFQSGRFGKLNKRVTFPENLNLTPYMSASGDGTDQYTLYGVVVHLDMLNASFFGHYICYTKDFRGIWYRIDDCKVSTVEVEEVLAQNAYMLLYHRINPRKDPFVKPEDHTTNTHSMSEDDPKRSKIQNSTNSSSLSGIISSIKHPSITNDESEDSHVSFISPSRSNYVNLEHSNLMKTSSSIEPVPPNPAVFLSAELEPIECEELGLHSHSAAADLSIIEEDDASVYVKEIDGPLSSIDEDMIMVEASTAPVTITTQNVDEESTLPLGSHPPESTARTCGSSGPANGVISAADPSLEHVKCNEVSMVGSRPKMESIFARGFLDKPFGNKSSSCKRTARPENRGASSSSKSNGYSNGHLNFDWDTELANGNDDDDTISSNSNMILSPPSISNGYRRLNRTECNGASSSLDNEIDEFRQEPPCSSFETSAELRHECSSNGDGLQFETDDVLSSYCADNKTLKSKSFEHRRDENRRLIKSNGFSAADFSD